MALIMRRRQLLPAMRPVWPAGLLGGALSVLAYGLVLWAQTRGALATVAALREPEHGGGRDHRQPFLP